MKVRAGPALLRLSAALAWLGLGAQLAASMRLALASGRPALAGALEALGYFTVLTNLLVALVSSACLAGRPEPLKRPGVVAAVATYIFVVGLIYSLLLRALWAPSGLQRLADVLLHDAVPLLYVVWWVGWGPRGRLSWGQPLLWLAWPLAYFAFSLARGALTGRYLYPFADVGTLGVAAVARNGVLLLVLFTALGLGAVALERARTPAA